MRRDWVINNINNINTEAQKWGIAFDCVYTSLTRHSIVLFVKSTATASCSNPSGLSLWQNKLSPHNRDIAVLEPIDDLKEVSSRSTSLRRVQKSTSQKIWRIKYSVMTQL